MESPIENKDESQKSIERYVRYVERVVRRFKSIGNLVRLGEVAPDKVNWALSQLYDMGLILNAEYQRVKAVHQNLEDRYQAWYDEKFIQARDSVLAFYKDNRSIKPSVKEYEIQLRHTNRVEYKDWMISLREAKAKVDFLLRLRDILGKYDSSLVTMAANMRGEMKALSVQDRGGSATSQNQRVRVTPGNQPPVDDTSFEAIPDSEDPDIETFDEDEEDEE